MSDEQEEQDQDHSGPLNPAAAVVFTQLWRNGVSDLEKLDVLASGFWKPIGPAPLRVDGRQDVFGAGPLAGAVVDILIHPDNPQTILAATGHGGVWISTDGGTTFLPAMDNMPSLSTSALAIDFVNHDIIYAGCGAPLLDAFSESAGLYKSIDRGITWSVADGGIYATVFIGRTIRRIVSNAADALLVGTSDGLFRSVDGGQNFGNNAPAFDNGNAIFPGSITSLLLDGASPTAQILFAVSGSGVFRLDLNGTGPAQALFSNPGAPTPPFSDIVLAQSTQPDAKTIYASVQFNRPGLRTGDPITTTFIGLFQSIDAGAHWTPRPAAKTAEHADTPPDQTNYDLTIGVDPQNASMVYLGFQELWRSLNGGGTFPPVAVSKGKVHFDHHALAFGTTASPFTPIYVGEDGGLARTDTGGAVWFHLNEGFATSLIFDLDIGRGAAHHDFTYAGMQDTGTGGHRTGDAALDWHVAIDGDGKRVAVDPSDPMTVYAFENEFFARSQNGGAAWQSSSATPRIVGIGLPNNKNVTLRVALNPNGTIPAQRVVYVTQGSRLFRSTNGGINFAEVTPKVPFRSDIVDMAFVPGDANRMWVVLADGTVHFTSDNLQTWDAPPFQSNPGGSGVISGIAIDPHHPDQVAVCYLSFSGKNARSRTAHVYIKKDGVNIWADASGSDGTGPNGNLPDLPYYDIAFDGSTNPSTLLVCTANSILCSLDLGNKWQVFGLGLPNVFCTSLAIDNVDTAANPRVLRVGTYGRSCFEFTKITGPVAPHLVVQGNLAFDPVVPSQPRVLVLTLFNAGNAPLSINAITGGSTEFTLANPVLPPPIGPGEKQLLGIHFQPVTAGIFKASFQIASNDPSGPITIHASGQGLATSGNSRLSVRGSLIFGTVNAGDSVSLTFTVFNTGNRELNILGVNRKDGSADFELLSPPAFPLLLPPTIDQEFTVQFKPSSNGLLTAAFQIDSDASRASVVMDASGTGSSHMSKVLIVVLVVVGAAIVVGGGIAIYEATK
ncbi:MAG: choice-of-anchor D domain-containing protein [Candidatus Sulfotelmatobacter sp.]